MSAAKVERLLNLSAALLAAERPLTAVEIRRRVPGYPEDHSSFRRAFERDKDDLRQMGIPLRLLPVEVEGTMTEGYRIPPEQYALRDPGLEADELAALHFAVHAVRLEGVSSADALQTLAGERFAAMDQLRGAGGVAPPDAPLDDANIGKFNALLREMSAKSQFIVITHNKKTMELNDTLYGVTMEEPGVSKMVSIELH